ncbi:hypothetical protein FRC00_010173 [Tulasnella sp. 408]|nr:hypothetical protein FRC00_010173 [Tulasnella sp. 408]
MSLPELPNDVWLEITRRLNVYDILHIRQVSKRLQSVTRLRAVWQTVLSQACVQYGVPRVPSHFVFCNDNELEYIACRPSRFQATLTAMACDAESPGRHQKSRREGSDVSMKSNRSDHPPNLFRPIHEYTLPDDNYTNVHLVPGGRWLLTVSAGRILRIWDLEPARPPSSPRSDSAPKPGYSRPPRFTGARPELYGQGNIDSTCTFMDAHLSNDRHELYVFLRTTSPDHNDPKVTAVCVKFDLLLDPPADAAPHPCHQVSTWTREAVSLDASWIKAFGADVAVFTRRTTRRTAWIWDWRRNLTKKLTNLQVPAGADSLLCMRIVSRHLVAVHSDGPRKCTISLYELPSLSSDPLARPSAEFEREPILHSTTLLPETQQAIIEPAETQPALFTSKFHGIHHVEAFRPKFPTRTPSRPTASNFQGLPRVTFVDRRSAMHSVPFNIGTVSLSEPFWIVPPQRSMEEDPPQDLQELGSFRIAIGVESVGDAAWRSRLQYYMRVDLNTIGERIRNPGQEDSRASVVSGDATIAAPGTIPYPRLRGRVSASRESAVYFQDRLFIASGKLTLLSVWSASDGIHAHTSKSLTEAYNEMGAEVIAYAWSAPEKVRPKPTMEEIIEDAMSECSSGSAESLSRKLRRVYEPSRRDSLGNRLSIKVDLFSGRMVVLDEVEGEDGEDGRGTVPRPPDTHHQQQQQQQQQQQYIQPHAIYHNPPPQQRSVSSSTPFPQQPSTVPQQQIVQEQPQSQPAPSEAAGDAIVKRKRGRPKGSKTKNRRVDGVLVPVHSLGSAATSATGASANITAPEGTTAAAQDDGDDEDDQDEPMLLEHSATAAVSGSPVRPNLSPDFQDGPSLGLGVGLARLGHHGSSSSSAPQPPPPQQPRVIKDFYDFQWQVMGLCSTFYESAGELVRSADPEVLAQSLSVGSGLDPFAVLQNAKDLCELLIANSQTLARGPVPPPVPSSMFPSHPLSIPSSSTFPRPEPVNSPQRHPSNYYPTPISPNPASFNPYSIQSSSFTRASTTAPPPPPPAATSQPPQMQPRPSTSSSLSGAITNPLVNPPQPQPSNPAYPHSAVATSQPTTQLPQPSAIVPPVPSRSNVQSTHGAWSDEETERLKTLAEQSKSRTSNGDIDWDWTVDQFGETRTRHQILIKATNLGLKPTSTHPSRLRKRLSMQNTQEQANVPPGSATLAQAPDTVREDHHLQGGSGSQSRGSDPSPRLAQAAGFVSNEAQGHFYAPNAPHPPTGSPSASVGSTPTLPSHDQHGQQSNLARQQYPSHHRRPSSSATQGSYHASPAMNSAVSAHREVPSPIQGSSQHLPGAASQYSQSSRSASYSYPQSQGPGIGHQQRGSAPVSAQRFPISPQVQQQQHPSRTVSHNIGPSASQPPATSSIGQYGHQQPSAPTQYGGRPSIEQGLALPRQSNGHQGPPQSMGPPSLQRGQAYSQASLPHPQQGGQAQYSPGASDAATAPRPGPQGSGPPAFGRSQQHQHQRTSQYLPQVPGPGGSYR